MKSGIGLLGIVLVVLGILMFAYQGITYSDKEQVAQIGNVEIIAEEDKTIFFPPLLGGAAIVVGLVLVMIGRKGKR